MSRLAQLVERKTLNLVVVGSSPTVGVILFCMPKSINIPAFCNKNRKQNAASDVHWTQIERSKD